jgi:hypothetical protein
MDLPKLQFVVDERLVALSAIQYGDRCEDADFTPNSKPAAVRNFIDVAWGSNRDACNFLRHGLSVVDVAGGQSIAKRAAAAEEFLQHCLTLPQFVAVLSETKESCNHVVEEWEQNLPRSSAEMCDILGYSICGEWKVFITPPALMAGMNTGKGIVWTHRTDWPNYSSVYLWHEVLHSEFGRSDTEHAVIELAADHELRVRLNGGAYADWPGHEYLNEERVRLLPHWRQYLSSSPRNIKDFAARHMAVEV